VARSTSRQAARARPAMSVRDKLRLLVQNCTPHFCPISERAPKPGRAREANVHCSQTKGRRIRGVIRAWISHDMVNRASISLGPSWSRSFTPAGHVGVAEKVLQAGAPRETDAGTVAKRDEKEVMHGPNNPTALRRASPGADLPEVPVFIWLGGERDHARHGSHP